MHVHICDGIEAYHPDVDVYEVREGVNGRDKLVAIFLHDNFARPMKNGGAWMSDYRFIYIHICECICVHLRDCFELGKQAFVPFHKTQRYRYYYTTITNA